MLGLIAIQQAVAIAVGTAGTGLGVLVGKVTGDIQFLGIGHTVGVAVAVPQTGPVPQCIQAAGEHVHVQVGEVFFLSLHCPFSLLRLAVDVSHDGAVAVAEGEAVAHVHAELEGHVDGPVRQPVATLDTVGADSLPPIPAAVLAAPPGRRDDIR